MKEEYIKKPAIDLTDLAIGIVILGIAVTIGSVILIAQRDSRLTELSVITTSNETILGNDGGTVLANTWVKEVTSVNNITNGTAVPTSNYTVTIDNFGAATVTMDGSSVYNGSNVNTTYSWYNTSRADWALANNAAVGLAEYGNWFKIIVIVGVASVVLSLIFMAFGRRSSEGDAGISY